MHQTESQEEIFALLSDPATHGGAGVRRIDTHAAAVFLAGERVYKVKRAVKFPFLDFSTLAKRKAACEAELEVNRPFAPEHLSRCRRDHARADGRLALDGTGEPVEWAVEMRRFDENATLDRLADRGADRRAARRCARARGRGRACRGAGGRGRAVDRRARAISSRRTTRPFARRRELFPARDAAALTQSEPRRARSPAAAAARARRAAGWCGAATATCISATSR